MSHVSTNTMGDLEAISLMLDGNVTYTNDPEVEILSYRDDTSQITAALYPEGTKQLAYHVEATHIKKYLSLLTGLKTDLSKRIQQTLTPQIGTNIPLNIAQRLIGDYFPLRDFSELSDLIKLHQQFAR